MSAKKIKAVVQHEFEEFNKGKAAAMAVIDEVYATDFVSHGSTAAADIRGLKNIKQSFSKAFDAYPDRHITIEDLIVQGDKVIVRWALTGTNTGELPIGIPATNKKMTNWGIVINRVVGGKYVERLERSDPLSVMQQLGVVPPLGKQK